MNRTTALRLAGIAVATTLLATTQMLASIGMPVSISIDSAEAARAGQPQTVLVTIDPALDLPHATFDVLPSSSWQILDGDTRFAGSLQKGKPVTLRFRAVPLSDRPEPLAGRMEAGGYNARGASLDPARLGGRFPEQGKGDGSEFDPESRNMPTAPPVFGPGMRLPQPLPPTAPRVPGQPAPVPTAQSPSPKKNDGSRSAAVSVTATGRFTYRDPAGISHPVRLATVELWDKNPWPTPDVFCGTSLTDNNGNYQVTGNCGDFFDGPDVYVRIVLNNSQVEVRPASVFAGTYTFQTSTVNNVSGGTTEFGTVRITSNVDAFHAHNVLMRSHNFMTNFDQPLPKVVALWPSVGTFYTPVVAAISLDEDVPFSEEGDVAHEFGHHVLWTRSESPVPNYANGNCDNPPLAGHCIYQPEEGVVSWTEGWPNFFAAVIEAQFNAADQWGFTRYTFETRQNTSAFAGQEDKIEGVIAGILWDLLDTVNDDQFETGSGRRDNFSLTFAQMWNVIRNYDPSSSLAHNHPYSIHEYFDGLREFHPSFINRIAEIYREHQITKPLPDLMIDSLGRTPRSVVRGGSFSLANGIGNRGQDRANSASTVSFKLVRKGSFPTEVAIGARLVPLNLLSDSVHNTTTTLTVPSTTPRDTWLLMACADTNDSVPESRETNNCLSGGSIVID